MIQVDDQIARIEALYHQLTGKSPARGDKPFAPIPPEANAESYVQDNLFRLQSTLTQLLGRGSAWSNLDTVATPSPIRFNVYDDPKEWVCTFEMAGVHKEDLSVQIENGVLQVTGSRRNPMTNGHHPVHMEVPPGRLARSVPLPPIKPQSARASLADGLLTVRLAKGDLTTERRNVDVEVG